MCVIGVPGYHKGKWVLDETKIVGWGKIVKVIKGESIKDGEWEYIPY